MVVRAFLRKLEVVTVVEALQLRCGGGGCDGGCEISGGGGSVIGGGVVGRGGCCCGGGVIVMEAVMVTAFVSVTIVSVV